MKKKILFTTVLIIILGGALAYAISYLNIHKEKPSSPEMNNGPKGINQLDQDAQEVEAAIKKAKEELGIAEFPDQVGMVKGIIHGGGPAPGVEVPGSFETAVQKNDDGSYLVTFTESWNAKDFHYAGEEKGNLSHYFKYKVTSYGAEAIESGGDFPPQAVK